MLKGKDIIYFSNDWSASHRTSSHHIAQELMKNNRILYVETGGMRPPEISVKDLRRIFLRFVSWLKRVRKVNDNFYLYSMFIFPFHGRWAYRLNAWLNIFFLKRAMANLRFKDPILWFIAPHVSYLADSLPSGPIVYYCTDNMPQAPGADKNALERNVECLLRRADVVFATSEHLCNLLKDKKINSNIFYSPHAVDFAHFSKAQDVQLPVAAEINCLKKPVVGFVGNVEGWVDLKLIAHIARSKPDWSIVLIGQIRVPVNDLSCLPNVICTGYRKYDKLPSYLKGFDAVIIPFLINELTESVNPLKLKEYLAAGKPVISVRLPEVEKFKGLVEIADSYQDFVHKIEAAYKTDSADKISKRMESVKGESWNDRAEKVCDIIENAIKRKT